MENADQTPNYGWISNVEKLSNTGVIIVLVEKFGRTSLARNIFEEAARIFQRSKPGD